MTLVWGVIALLFVIVALITQVILYVIVAGLAGLVGALAAFTDLSGDEPLGTARPAAAKTANPRGKRSTQPQSSAVPKCTRTGTPIDACTCARRHVATADGARRYKLTVGAPMVSKRGSKVKLAKEPKVPTTNKAKPLTQVPGERMRRVQ